MAKKVCARLRELAHGQEAKSRNLGQTFLAISVMFRMNDAVVIRVA